MQIQPMHPQLPRLAKHKLDSEANRGVPRLLRLLAHVNLLEYLDTQAPQYEQPPKYEQSELEDLAALLKEHLENKTQGFAMQLESDLLEEDDLLSRLGPGDVLQGLEEMLPAYQPPTAEVTVAEVEVDDD